MASIEFIQKRITGKEKELEKLNKKLERIRKAEAFNWADGHNPYYYNERDLKWCLKDIEAAKEALDGYMAQLATENDKANSRNVPAITEFLDAWKARCTEWYMRRYEAWKEAKVAYRKWLEECNYYKYVNNYRWKYDNRELWKEYQKEYDKKHADFRLAWNQIEKLAGEKCGYAQAVENMLDADYRAKYDWLLDQVTGITGEITDAASLRVAETGELNGFITGKKGIAKVNTFSAGGWNIQCFHYRTKVTKAA